MDIILIVAAALPAIALMIYIFNKDKVEHEPIKLLVMLCILGCVACIPAVILETMIENLFGWGSSANILSSLLENFLGVALIEEACKFCFLLIVWRNAAFDHVFDAIVYAVFVSLGFALLENVLYVLFAGSFLEGLELAGMRAILSVPLHMFCGVWMGYFFGLAKEASVKGDQSTKSRNITLSLVVPIAMHGWYDFSCSSESGLIELTFFVFVVAMYVLAFKRIGKSAKEDRAFSTYAAAGMPAQQVQQPQPYASAQQMRPYAPVQQPHQGASASFAAGAGWFCPSCGTHNEGKFCTGCGSAKPTAEPSPWYCPQCGTKNEGSFCTNCGTRKA